MPPSEEFIHNSMFGLFGFISIVALLLLSVLVILTTPEDSEEAADNVPKVISSPLASNAHITWSEYFMSVARLAALRSKDPCSKVGACIVNSQNKIVATGYNGMPNGVHDDKVPWGKEGPFYETKYAYVVHAELNAILNSVLTDQTGCRVYVTLFPCNECAKAIIQSGIRHVIYLSDKHKDKDSTRVSKKMLRLANVEFEQFKGSLLI